MRHTPLLAVVVLSGTLGAQNFDQNKLGMWDRTTEFTGRGALGAGTGTLSQKHPTGIAAVRDLSLVQYVVQDQNALTQEPYSVALAGTNNQGLPDYAGQKVYAANLVLPSRTGVAAWLVTHNFNTTASPPVVVRDDGTGFHHCWQIPSNGAWPTDGLSIHFSQGAPYNNTLLCTTSNSHREIPRTETTQIVSELGWSQIPNASPAAALQNLAWRVMIGSDQATLEGGAANSTYNCPGYDPNRGYASLDPDFANSLGNTSKPRYDDPAWFIEAGPSHANGIAVLFHAIALGPYGKGIAIPGWRGTFLLDVTDPLFGIVQTTSLDATGAGSIRVSLGPANSSARAIAGSLPSWTSQALVLKSGPGGLVAEFTNVFTMRPHKSVASSSVLRAANLSTTAALAVPIRTGDRSLYVRNDGPGPCTVTLWSGNTQLPGSWPVNERTAKRVPVVPGASQFVLSTRVTRPNPSFPGVNVVYALNY